MSEINHHTEHKEHKEKAQKFERDSQYWQSLEEYNKDPEFAQALEAEFQSSPLREGSEKEEGWARREFLKLMGASMAMASAGCIRRPAEKIVPYNKQPEEVTLGVDNHYTSTWFDGSEGFGLLVRTREGRPLKVEGNPEHPLNKGGLSARANAHILSLYDPERLKGPKKLIQNKDKTNFEMVDAKYEEADKEVVDALNKGGVAVLTGHLNGPSLNAVVGDFCQAFGATHYVWEPLSVEDIRKGQKASYGEESVPFYRFDQAKVIVSIDADFLGTWMMPTTYARQFSEGRRDPKNMSKLVAFDSGYSLTGANADVRVRIKPSQQVDVVMGLAHEIIVKKGATKYAGNGAVKEALAPFAGVVSKLKLEPAVFEKLAEDLIKNKGKSLVVAGGLMAQTENSESLQIAVNFLNSALENDGETVVASSGLLDLAGSHASLETLADGVASGKVKTVIIHNANPLYSFAAAEELSKKLKGADLIITTADRVDETSKIANFVFPDHHVMETWGDSEFVKGVVTLQQPTIRPMYDTRSFMGSLMTWAYMAKKGSKRLKDIETSYDFIREVWKTEVHSKLGSGKAFEAFWDEALQKGVVGAKEIGANGLARGFKSEALSNVKASAQDAEFELVMYPKIAVRDGRLANVAWLHEMPDPITKVCWDNYAMVSIHTAEKMNLKLGDVVELTVGGQKMKLPAYVQPGLHEQVVAVAVGYGRTAAGKVGNKVGVNVYPLAQKTKSGYAFSGLKTLVQKTSERVKLAQTQTHHSMEGRQIVIEATLKQYQKDPGAGIHKHSIFSIWGGHQYNGHKWAMAVDLNTCTGCSACIVACQSENNIHVVGKRYVIEGREMHWMRVDRYFVGDPANAETVFQPVMCQQCDNAPCETVCPVLATVHTSEGLNDMVYNRCVGTRYCANNCPYKVRRFNWFNFAKNIEKPMHMALNPDVTVRPRGVMEKCTFCVHRIKATKIQAKIDGTKLKDGDIQTACQQSCPTNAIIFGDMNDENSAVGKIFRKEKRSYALLEEFHAAPSVRYLTKIRNNDKETRFEGAHQKGGHS